MKRITNYKAAVKLLERYNTIGRAEISSAANKVKSRGSNGTFDSPLRDKAQQLLTGFGSCLSCSLCKEATCCSTCVYSFEFSEPSEFCINGNNAKTYHALARASSVEDIASAYAERASRLKFVLSTIKELSLKNEIEIVN